MKLIIEKEKVIEGLQKATNILPQKTGAAYLRSIWIKAHDSNVTFYATDVSIEFQGTYSAQVETEGLVGVQGRFFVDLMRHLPNGKITFTLDEKNSILNIEQGRKKYKLPTNDSTWFQDFSAFPMDNSIMWSGDFFMDVLDKVSFCISDDESTDALSCMNMKPVKEDSTQEFQIDVCSLNGHQFALFSFSNEDLFNILPKEGLLIQKKYISELKKWLSSDEIEFNITDKRFYLRTLNGETLSFPRVVYEYPDYSSFLNNVMDSSNSLKIDRKESIEALGRLNIFNTKNISFTNFELSKDEAILSVQGQETGSAVENLFVQYVGNINKIAFPTKELVDILGHFQSATLSFRLTNDEGPCSIQGKEDLNYLIILMPMKVNTPNYYSEEDNV